MRNSFPAGIPGIAGDFAISGREIGKALIAKDWAKTPLGPIEDWPQSLRTTISLCLASNFPISIAWGPQRVQIYNDGYWPICGVKHPQSMGQDFKECWNTAWPVIGEAFERAQNGEASFLEDERMFLDRQGYLEETFFTFSFSPILDEAGKVGGLFHPVNETTGRMLSERRSRALRDLAARAGSATTVEEVCIAAAEVLGKYEFDVPFGLIYLTENGKREGRLAASFGLQGEMLDVADWETLQTDQERGWPTDAAFETGQPQLVTDLESRFGALHCGPYPEAPSKALVAPIPGLGRNRCAGVLIAGVSSRLPFNDAYSDFYVQVTSFLATALAKARSAEEERYKAAMLTELDRAKSAFFSNVSHEFRTPLTLMLSPLEELLDRAEIRNGPLNEDLSLVHRNGLRLLKLVNTLLEFSRIEGGRAQPVYKPTDLSALTADLASAFRSAVENAGLELIVDCEPLDEPILVDREMWEKIVLNLVSNAFKFTFSGRITVSLRQEETHIVLAVADTGGGIDQNELPRIFERFHRVAGARSRTHEGTGIGLALVKDLVLLHDGSIMAASEVGRGSRFTVKIPRRASQIPAEPENNQNAKAAAVRPFVNEALSWLGHGRERGAGESTAAPQPSAPLQGKPIRGHILLADDNSDMLEYLRRILNEHYEVHGVRDGLEALDYVRKFDVDLVLTDVMMPRMNGFELLRELRASSRTQSIPIILLSARAGEEARLGGLEAGADDYLTKPFTRRELLARVDVHLNMARIRKETATALREMNERHCQMIETANDSFVSTDESGRVLVWNKQAETTFGWSREEAIGRSVAELIAPAALLTDGGEIERFFKRGESSILGCKCIEVPAVTRNGEALSIEITAWPVNSRGILTFSAFMRDIGQRKQVEADLRAAKVAAETANRAKSEFLSSVSHEIRTPMNAILGMADMLWESELGEAQRHYVEVFRRAGGNLLVLINDILDLSKIESGNFALEQIDFDLRETVEQVIEILSPKAEAKGLSLRAQIETGGAKSVIGDPARLQQILINLTGNAIKFTERGEVVVKVRPRLPETPSEFEFEVCDTGIGIANDKLAIIFEDFTQAESFTTRRYGGTGLGLGISRRLVRLMGGELRVRSELHKGSAFFFHAVLRIGSEQRVTTPARLSALAGQSVLIIDNNSTNRLILGEMCTAWGMDVTCCASGYEAIARVSGKNSCRFALALVDRSMPNMDGFEAAAELKQLCPEMKILIVSSDTQAGDALRCRELGLAGHLMKPIRRAELLRQVVKTLSTPQESTPPTRLAGKTHEPERTAGRGVERRILMAEDSEDNRFLLQAYCKGTAYQPSFVENGEEAVLAYQAGGYDMIAMDVHMPVMDGLTAVRRIRAIERKNGDSHIPIVALTANALPRDVQEATEAGCDAHLAKPISRQKLLSALDKWHSGSTLHNSGGAPVSVA